MGLIQSSPQQGKGTLYPVFNLMSWAGDQMGFVSRTSLHYATCRLLRGEDSEQHWEYLKGVVITATEYSRELSEEPERRRKSIVNVLNPSFEEEAFESLTQEETRNLEFIISYSDVEVAREAPKPSLFVRVDLFFNPFRMGYGAGEEVAHKREMGLTFFQFLNGEPGCVKECLSTLPKVVTSIVLEYYHFESCFSKEDCAKAEELTRKKIEQLTSGEYPLIRTHGWNENQVTKLIQNAERVLLLIQALLQNLQPIPAPGLTPPMSSVDSK